jgi:hypothetical protein
MVVSDVVVTENKSYYQLNKEKCKECNKKNYYKRKINNKIKVVAPEIRKIRNRKVYLIRKQKNKGLKEKEIEELEKLTKK